MSDNNNPTTNPTFPDPQKQDVTQPTPVAPSSGNPFGTENVETPPPPITLSQEEAKKTQEFPTAGPTVDIPPVVVTTNEARKYSLISKIGGKKMVATILGLLVLVGGVGAGVYLTKQSQEIREKAAIEICSEDSTGGCASKDWGYACSDKEKCNTIDQTGNDGLLMCECGPTTVLPTTPPATTITSSNKCETIKAYTVTGDPASSSSTWTEVSLNDKTTLQAGDVIYFVVKATYTATGDNNTLIDKAKFTINKVEQAEATAKTPVCASSTCTIEFYQKYTIPSNKYDFTVTATLHLKGTDVWF